jgi:prepilin-type N-terminal cleavage/methylation domain-containing protein
MQVRRHGGQTGFSLLEMMLATVILLVGLVAVAQLVPISVMLNYRNRMDSSAVVFGERLLDQFLDQPLSATLFTDTGPNNPPCEFGCAHGDPTQPNQPVGSPFVNGQLNWAAGTLPNYSLTFPPGAPEYDVRWAVITMGNGTTASAKRFILGVRAGGNGAAGGSAYFLPVTLDATVSR